MAAKAAVLSGVVGADDIFFLKSFKGQRDLLRPAHKRGRKAAKPGFSTEQIPALIARDQNGEVFDATLEKVVAKQLGAALLSYSEH